MEVVRNVILKDLLFLIAGLGTKFTLVDVSVDSFRQVVSINPVQGSELRLITKDGDLGKPESDSKIDPDMDINDLIG